MSKITFDGKNMPEGAHQLLHELGLSEEKIASGVIYPERDIPKDRKEFADFVFSGFGTVGIEKPWFSPNMITCVFRNFVASLDGDQKGISSDDISKFNQIKKELGVITLFDTYMPAMADKDLARNVLRAGLGVFNMAFTQVFYIKDAKLYDEYSKYLRETTGKDIPGYEKHGALLYYGGGYLNGIAENVKKYVEDIDAAKARLRGPKTREIVFLEKGFASLGIKNPKDIIRELFWPDLAPAALYNIFNNDIRAISPEQISKMSDAVALANALGIRGEEAFAQMISQYRDIGFRLVQSSLHHFVNPRRYRLPPGRDPIEDGDVDEEKWGQLTQILRDRNSEGIPSPVNMVSDNIMDVYVRSLQFDGPKISTGTLTCVGSIDGYGIYATAAHVLKGQRGGKIKIINKDVGLIAIREDPSNRTAKPIVVETRSPSKIGAIYTIASDDSEIVIRSSSSAKNDGERLSFKGLNEPGDSGAPVVNKQGKMIGIVLGGDKRLTVYAFSNMALLRSAVKDFMADLKHSETPVS